MGCMGSVGSVAKEVLESRLRDSSFYFFWKTWCRASPPSLTRWGGGLSWKELRFDAKRRETFTVVLDVATSIY